MVVGGRNDDGSLPVRDSVDDTAAVCSSNSSAIS